VPRVPALALLAVVLTACGSHEHAAGEHRAPRPSLDDFVKEGNRVCIDADRRILPIGKLTRDPAGWTRTASAAEQNLREMRMVVPPAARAAAFDRMVADGAAVVRDLDRIRNDLLSKKVRVANAAQQAALKSEDEVHTAARHAGLTYCQQALNNWPA
jgi:hypothetical protein